MGWWELALYIVYIACKPWTLQDVSSLTIYVVQNLTAAVDPHNPFLTLKWDPPCNPGDVTAYDFRYKPSNSWWFTHSTMVTVNAPVACIHFTGKSGYNLRTAYDFEVRSRDGDCKGEWSRLLQYTGDCCTNCYLSI